MARKKKPEDHVNHEAWAIPYGDLITLLLAFFVVMYAISSVNEGKYRVLSESMVAAFRGSPRTTQPIQIGDNRPAGNADQGANPMSELGLSDPRTLQLPREVLQETLSQQSDPDDTRTGTDPAAGNNLQQMEEEVRSALGDLIEMDQIRVRQSDFWLEVEVQTDILFPTGIARISDDAVPVLQRLAAVLAPFPNPVQVEGHTDNVPISTARFPSNWELSAARAATVVRLFGENGLDAERLAVMGMGEHQPVADNDTAEGRNRNRRVLVVVLANNLNRIDAEQARSEAREQSMLSSDTEASAQSGSDTNNDLAGAPEDQGQNQ